MCNEICAEKMPEGRHAPTTKSAADLVGVMPAWEHRVVAKKEFTKNRNGRFHIVLSKIIKKVYVRHFRRLPLFFQG